LSEEDVQVPPHEIIKKLDKLIRTYKAIIGDGIKREDAAAYAPKADFVGTYKLSKASSQTSI
jgi:hypothetical protein